MVYSAMQKVYFCMPISNWKNKMAVTFLANSFLIVMIKSLIFVLDTSRNI